MNVSINALSLQLKKDHSFKIFNVETVQIKKIVK
jgi:hypothetical protein